MLITFLIFLLLLQIAYLALKNRKTDAEGLNRLLSLFVFFSLMALFFLKNEYFGADTKNYLNEFNYYCLEPDRYVGLDYTYRIIFNLLNFFMFGACEVNWIIWLWPYFIISIICVALFILKIDKLFIITLFSSFIGIELLTNAMRQGASIAILFLAFGFYLRRNYIYFAVLTVISLLFHQASALIICIFIISRLNYKVFIPLMIFGVFIIFGTTIVDFVPGILTLKASVYKYMPYASEELIVRLIGMVNILFTCIVYFFSIRRFQSKDPKTINWIINILAVCSIVSIVPYLGFRVIYGVYPLLLLMTYCSVKRYSRISFSFLSVIACANVLISIVWLCGSAHMRAIPFVSFI